MPIGIRRRGARGLIESKRSERLVSKMNGSCLCGSIRYTCNAEPLLTAVCHCPHCQKQSGTSFSPKDSLVIAGQTLKTFEDVGESGLPVRRQFCGKCGS